MFQKRCYACALLVLQNVHLTLYKLCVLKHEAKGHAFCHWTLVFLKLIAGLMDFNTGFQVASPSLVPGGCSVEGAGHGDVVLGCPQESQAVWPEPWEPALGTPPLQLQAPEVRWVPELGIELSATVSCLLSCRWICPRLEKLACIHLQVHEYIFMGEERS